MNIQKSNQSSCAGDDLPSGTFVLHSRFNNVVNFINGQNQLAYVTTKEDILASNAIFVPGVKLRTISSMTISSQTITLDNVRLDREKMSIYDSGIHFKDVDFAVFESRLLEIPSLYPELFPEKSLFFLFHKENEKFFTSGFDQQFMLNAKKSCEFILSDEIVKGIKAIRGTGYGLTPSGDDFTAGFLLGLHFNECKYKIDLSELRNEIYHTAIGSNLLTNSFLINAKNRKYFKPLKKILLLLGGEKHSSIKDELEQLLSIGATSGADFFSGYLFPIKHKVGL